MMTTGLTGPQSGGPGAGGMPLLPLTEQDLPCNLDLEQALLAILLCYPAQVAEVSEDLRAEHFANSLHGLIYQTAVMLDRDGTPPTMPAVSTYLQHDRAYLAAGGSAYLAGLLNALVTANEAKHYARQITDLYYRREMIFAALGAVTEAARPTLDRSSQDVLTGLEVALSTIAERGDRGGFVGFDAAMERAVEAAEQVYKGLSPGVLTGLPDLDAKTGGLHPEDLSILAGRPGMGKTALATGWALSVAQQGHPVAFFSLEMGQSQLAGRVLAGAAGVNSARLRTNISEDDMRALIDARGRLATLPLYIDDTPALTAGGIASRARRLKTRLGGLGLVVIDYLGLVAADGPHQNKVHAIEAVTNALKALAKELRCPVLLLCQLSRAVEQREDKRPVPSDLRDSGGIEQDADNIYFVYRHEYYLSREEPVDMRSGEREDGFITRRMAWQAAMDACRGQADVILAKNRHGPLATVRVGFDAQAVRFLPLVGVRHDG